MPGIYTKSGLSGAALKAAAEAVHTAARPEALWDLRTGWALESPTSAPTTEVQCSVAMGTGWVATGEDPATWAVRQDLLAEGGL